MSLPRDLPEERVRARLIDYLINNLGYPQGLIAVEKELGNLPHLKNSNVQKRRLDVLVFSKNLLQPLLLIECKAEKATQAALNQVLGYNEVVKAPFVAIVGKTEALCAKADGTPIGGLMPYSELIEKVQS